MSIQNIAAIMTLSQLISGVVSGKCPQYVSEPCVCNSQVIRCEGNANFDLKTVFTNISNSLNETEKQFQFFVLNNSGIKSLEKKTFSGIRFRFLTIIDAKSLEEIDSNAFEGTAHLVEVFEFMGENNLKNMSQLFGSIASLENVVSIILNAFGLKSLPSYAFYSLNKLQELMLINGQLNHISDHSFHFHNSSNQSLIIDLSNNNLTEFSFQTNSLIGIKRPLELDLRDNRLTVLEQKLFKQFLLTDSKNSINLMANPLNCSDCRMQWLVEDKHRFESQVLEARCSHFVSVFELELNYFQHCVQ